MARTGKIARLPFHIREELNRRLRDGHSGRAVLDWVNHTPEFQALQQPQVTDQNLSDWRLGGYQEWLARLDQVDTTKELAAFSMSVSQASGQGLSEGAAQILAGRILTVLEGLQSGDADPEQLRALTEAVTKLRAGDQSAQKLKMDQVALDQNQEKLELEKAKYRRLTGELFLKWCDNEQARQIANSPASNTEKLEKLGQLMFGEDWK